jgi:KaiC/GvpD/RAD55 family RecA-like ATPase
MFVSTGVKALDRMLGGGYPCPSIILVRGSPGSGKTPLAIAFAAGALKAGKRCIYVCANNHPSEIRDIAGKIGYDISGAAFVDAHSMLLRRSHAAGTGHATGLPHLAEVIEGHLPKRRGEAIVFDSLSALLLYHDEKTVEGFVQALAAMARERRGCSMLLFEKDVGSGRMRAMLEYLADGALLLEEDTINVEHMAGLAQKKKGLRFDITRRGVIQR